MRSRSLLLRVAVGVVTAALLPVSVGAAAAPQGRGTAATSDSVGVDPITCWWRTTAGAVRIGESFGLVLTCAVLETRSTTVVADVSQLDPAVLQVAPFQVVDGTLSPPIRTALRRFFQYDYTVRVVGNDVAGTDLTIPPVTINYRVQTRVTPGAAANEGRERQYVLPPLPVRALSIVPAGVTELRDQPGASFQLVDARLFRARTFSVAAVGLYAVGLVVFFASLLQAWQRRRERPASTRPLASDRAILQGVASTLEQFQREGAAARSSAESIAQALAAIRIAACYALDRRPSQSAYVAGTERLSGQLAFPTGRLGGGRVLVSGSVTADTIAASRHGNGALAGKRGSWLRTFESALDRMTQAAYGRAGPGEGVELGAAVASSQRAVREMAREKGAIGRTRETIGHKIGALGARLWAR